jgi:hypothetical protein
MNISNIKKHKNIDNVYLDYITHYKKYDFSECDDRHMIVYL